MKMITQEDDDLLQLHVPRKDYTVTAPLNTSGKSNTCQRTVSTL